MRLKLRGYQRRAEDAVLAAFASGKRRVLLAEPTGSGKTCQAAHMIDDWAMDGKRVLFVAHRREIVNQAYQTCIDWGVPYAALSVIMSGDPRENLSAQVQIASKDTLARRRVPDNFDVVVVDEAHHAAADSYMRLLLRNRRAVLLGMTATPYRLDGRGLKIAFDELVVGATPSQLIRDGHLAKPRIFTVPKAEATMMAAALREVRRVSGDFQVGALSKAMRANRLVGNIPDHWEKHSDGRPTVVYAVDIEHAKRIAKAFRKRGVRVELVTGNTDTDERGDIVGDKSSGKRGRLATGETQVVVNCMVLTEGWDCPEAKCIILARPTWSLSLFIQMCGRGLRPSGQTPVILDHAGNVFRHGIVPHQDLDLSLEHGVVRRTSKLAPWKECPECLAVCARLVEVCEECGHKFSIDRELEERDGQLEEMSEELLEQRKKEELVRLRATVRAGKLPSAVVERFYAAKFGAPAAT